MFSDNSLLPKETVRLAALGILSEAPMVYADLANAVRQFVGRIVGPSLELTGPSIELLRYEGLVHANGDNSNAVLTLTDEGREELLTLLKATVRPPLTDMSKLVIALKMRFMPLLDAGERRDQVDLLIDACELELARLSDMHDPEADEHFFQDWLAHDIDLVENRLTWFRALRDRV
jgi:DNA-binding PadR family transcriptional regulator